MKHLFSIPNLITFARILFIPVFVFVFFTEYSYKDYLAAAIFIMLSLSDALDGYIARKHKQVTNIGKLIDPIADKLLIAAALFALIDRIAIWMIIIIVARELIITVARILFVKKKVIPASILGKLKTISQIVAIVAVILQTPFDTELLFIAVLITVISGIDYLVKIAKLMDENIYTIPNLITSIRFVLITPLVISIISNRTNIALVIFTIIIISDKLDGISARITAQITAFGRIYDSFVDFCVLISGAIALYAANYFDSNWIVALVIASSLLVLLKTLYYHKKKETASGLFGKIMVVLSYVSIVAFLINFEYRFIILFAVSIVVYIYIAVDFFKLMRLYKNGSN